MFTYTLRDADGDESTTTITIDVHNSCLKAVSDTDVTVYEKALDLTKDGQDLAAGTVTGSDPGTPAKPPPAPWSARSHGAQRRQSPTAWSAAPPAPTAKCCSTPTAPTPTP